MRVLIIDDHPLVGEALAQAVRRLDPAARPRVCTELTQGLDALDGDPFDLVIADLIMPGVEGFAGFIQVRDKARGAPVVVVSAQSDPRTVTLARALGAAGFINKQEGLAEVEKGLRAVRDGEAVYPKSPPPAPETLTGVQALQSLSPAQARVMLAVADGRSNKQIAYDLGLSESTVKIHVSAALRKLGVVNRARAIILMQPLLRAPQEPPPSA
jgi:DNA-binding NarL/FixJ family response regulator